MSKLRKIKDAFDCDGADWRPYWRNADLAAAQGLRALASLYLHHGKRELLVVSNLHQRAEAVALTLNLKKMGLRGAAKDAWDDKPLAVENGKLTVPVESLGFRMIWIE